MVVEMAKCFQIRNGFYYATKWECTQTGFKLNFLNFEKHEEYAFSKRFCSNFADIGAKHVPYTPTSSYMVYRINGSYQGA